MFSPPVAGLKLYWRVDDASQRLQAQARYTGGGAHGAHWIGVGFALVPGSMIGSTAVIGSRDDGVGLYNLGAKFPSAVTLLDFTWQTLTGTSFEFVDGVTILTFEKRLDEDQLQTPSDQVKILPNLRMTDLIFAIGKNAPDPSGAVRRQRAQQARFVVDVVIGRLVCHLLDGCLCCLRSSGLRSGVFSSSIIS